MGISFQGDANSTNIATGATGNRATSDGQSSTAHRQRFLALLLTAGSDTATATVYDGQSAGGTKILKISATANTSTHINIPDQGKVVSTNIFVAVTGTASEATVFWN